MQRQRREDHIALDRNGLPEQVDQLDLRDPLVQKRAGGIAMHGDGTQGAHLGRFDQARAGLSYKVPRPPLRPCAEKLPAPVARPDRAGALDHSTQFASARSEEHTSELQSLMPSSYAVFCLQKKRNKY